MEFFPNQLNALGSAQGADPTPKNILRIGKEFGVEAARWAFEQWELRKRAKAKFVRADEMLFVREALEQATHEKVAQYRASRFPQGELVADLTTGIGSDLIALAQRGPVTGYELDPERAACARFNSGAEVREEDSLTADWDAQYAIADPARRIGGKRTISPRDFTPDPNLLAERMQDLKLACIKLTPMMSDPDLRQLGKSVEFWSFGRECREACVWLGSEAEFGSWAVHIESGERIPGDQPPHGHRSESGKTIYDVDSAAVRAHALGEFDLPVLGDSGWLTGSEPNTSPWLRSYQVLWSGRFDLKLIKQEARNLDAELFEVKQSRAGIDVERTKKQLRTEGSQPASVLIWAEGRALKAAICVPPL